MSIRKFLLQHEKNLISLIALLPFLLFLFIGCKGPDTSAITCTYTLTMDPNTTNEQKEQAKSEFEAAVQNSAGSAEKGTTCHSTTTWDESDPKQVKATVTIECTNRSDSGAIRPPAQTKPPASRVSNGTITKVNCTDE